MSKIEFYLSKIIQYGLYAILLTPLVFWPRALYAFMTPKFILFQVLVEIVFAAWVALIALNNANKNANKNEQLRMMQIANNANDANSESKNKLAISNIRNDYILLALSGFIAISFTSAIFGVDFSRSFWGIGARMTGIFAELHFFAWFLVLASSLNNANNTNDKMQMMRIANSTSGKFVISGISNKLLNWHYYLNFSFLVSILVTLSAFYENTAWRLVFGSTLFNNPTFAGPYFIFHFFWGLYGTIFNFQFSIFKLKGWVFGAGATLLAFVIFLGQIRGVILGVLVGLFVLGFGMIFTDAVKRRFKIIILASFAMIFIGLAGLWLSRESSFVQNTSILKRLTQISLSQTTVQTRFFVWRSAFQGFKERPLIGVGPENFNYVFNANYNPSLLKYGFGETWFDKPHNEFLEVASETGLLGSIFYIFILIAALVYLFRLFKSGEKILALIIGSSFTAYLTVMFFSFDSFGSWFGLFLMLGFLASYNNANEMQEMRMPRIANIYSQLASLAIVLVTFVLLYVNYGMWRANIADADALRVFSINPAQGIELFKKSLSYNTPYRAEYQFDLFASVAGAISKNLPLPNLEQNINLVLEESEKAVADHPNNAAYYTDLVKLYNILAEKGRDPKIISWAETYGKKSLELSPNRQETLYYLARTALLKGDTKFAVTLTKNAVDAEPFINVSHWYFGLALIADNQKESGKIEIRKALELGYKPQNATENTFIKNIRL